MILQGKTPRGLSRAGLVAVLGLGAVLLPLLPSWGQTQAPADKTTSNRVTAPAADTVNRTPSGAPDVQGGTTTAPATATGLPTAPARADVGAEDLVYGAQTPAEQVELLKAQLDVRRADLEETRALLDQARRQEARMQELSKRGATGADELDRAHTDVKVLEARLRGKEARVREAVIQLQQAARRRGPSRTAAPRANQAPAGNHAPSPDLTTPVPPQPGDRAAANSFGRPGAQPPAAGHERLYPLLGARTVEAPPANTEQRLRELEKKIDGLLREVESLRRELHPGAGSPDLRRGDKPAAESPAPRSSSLPPAR